MRCRRWTRLASPPSVPVYMLLSLLRVTLGMRQRWRRRPWGRLVTGYMKPAERFQLWSLRDCECSCAVIYRLHITYISFFRVLHQFMV
ncbi:hypothetical protein GDO81_020021 [Engystomops pustulosus]|uniref:Secreted protein n=1 Tax=Engystomops pustulosus TaxID=76066 RepID=A0AAV6YRG1_ENGPU|nr:hypothetical protein GDO81_020021 [Engystomops pustulosus]